MAAILNSAILDSDILHKITFICSFSLNLMMAVILNSANLHSTILVFPLKLTHICQDWFPLFTPKKTFTHSFWLNLMIAAIMNSAMLDSDTAILDSGTLLSSLRFTPKHSPSTLTLTQTNSIWLTWWWQLSWIQPFCTKCYVSQWSLVLKFFECLGF